MFDIKKAIRESNLPKEEILRLEREIQQEFPNDKMMYELHLIRALKIAK
mgnify:CR=1 FL=1